MTKLAEIKKLAAEGIASRRYRVGSDEYDTLPAAESAAGKLASELLAARATRRGVTSLDMAECTVSIYRDDNTVAATVRPS